VKAMAFLLMGAGLLLFGAGAIVEVIRRPQSGNAGRVTCVDSHSQDGLNYPWLSDLHGGLDHVEYEEPAGSGVWNVYTRDIWMTHCKVVSHKPGDLVAAHMRAFVDKGTRFARLMFFFRDGTTMEPTQDFYQREAAWISRYGK
jgi:hypothetical protein